MNLQGKVALVTGAGKRVGQAIALALADRGTAVAIHYRSSRGGAEEAAARIIEQRGRAQICGAELDEIGKKTETQTSRRRTSCDMVTCAPSDTKRQT